MQRSIELDGTDGSDRLARLEVSFEGRDQMRGVNADVDEDIEGLNRCDIHGNQAAMSVVDQQVTSQSASSVVVNAAGAVGDISHDERFRARTKLRQDIRDGCREEKKSLWEL